MKRRVLLVGAMNGTGKTSLLIALYLGLFGREAMHFVQGVRLGATEEEQYKSYRTLIQQILHRPALGSDDPSAGVQLVFDVDGKNVTVTRTWHYRKGGVPRDLDGEGEEVVVTIDNRVVRIPGNWKDANNRIATELFPQHVLPCFFFDGEQAQERVEASGAAALSEAIKVLFGTSLVDELDQSLKHYVYNERSSAKRDLGDVDIEALDRKRRRRDEIEEELADIAKQLAPLRSDADAAEAARNEKILELTQMTGDAAVDIKLLYQTKSALESQERELGDRLRESLAALALPMALSRLRPRVEEILRGEIVRDRWLLLKEEALSKADQIVRDAIPTPGDTSITPPLDETQCKALAERLRAAIQTLWYPPPTGCAEEFSFGFLGNPERSATLARIIAASTRAPGDIGDLASQWEVVKSRLRDVQRRLDAVADVKPRIEAIKARLAELDERIRSVNATKTNLELKERGLQSEHKDLLGTIGQMESAKRKLGPVEMKLELAERVRSVIADIRDDLVPLCKRTLEERCTQHFRGMISEEYRRYRIEFDHEFQPMLTGAGASPVFITTLSGAQKRAFGLAFTLAVAEITGEEAPLVIDTPVGNADSEYRTRMLTYLSTAAPGQVIFLSHDEEIHDEYLDALEPYLLQRYLIDFEHVADGAGVSTVKEGHYFHDRRGDR